MNNTELEVVSKALVDINAVSAGLAKLSEQYAGVVYPVITADGMAQAKAARLAIREPRYNVERIRKDAKKPILDLGKKLDAEAARITAELLKLEEPIDQQIKEEEGRKERERQAAIETELKRVQSIQERIAGIRGAVEVCTRYNCEAKLIAEHIGHIQSIEIDDSFQEFEEQAADAKLATLATLREAHAAALSRESEQARIAAERAELERLRAEQRAREGQEKAARETAEREARAKREAEEKAAREKLAAEQAEVARLQKIENDRLAAERAELEKQRKAEQDKIEAENRKLAAERAKLEREQAEAKRKAEAVAARERAEKEAERKRKEEAERLAKKAKYPGERAILDALAEHFGVSEIVARSWLVEIRRAA